MDIMIKDRELIHALRDVGINAKRWRNSNGWAPPADVNFKGVMRVHTGGHPALIAIDKEFHQAVIEPTEGRMRFMSFLVGIDETSNFVCRLPRAVESVAQAHEVLRPDGVPEGARRQGEWFFLPTTTTQRMDMLVHDIREQGLYAPIYRDHSIDLTTHRAEEFCWGPRGEFMVRGQITDNRPRRHAPLDLGKERWHQAIHNTELSIPTEPERPHRHYD